MTTNIIATRPAIIGAALLVIGAIAIGLNRADALAIDLATLSGLAICF
jgi:hypothetical protein